MQLEPQVAFQEFPEVAQHSLLQEAGQQVPAPQPGAMSEAGTAEMAAVQIPQISRVAEAAALVGIVAMEVAALLAILRQQVALALAAVLAAAAQALQATEGLAAGVVSAFSVREHPGLVAALVAAAVVAAPLEHPAVALGIRHLVPMAVNMEAEAAALAVVVAEGRKALALRVP